MTQVLITTSGVGSRLGNLTKYTNKALVRVGKKPAISYIIESYPEDTEFVVTLGYYGDQVRQFLSLAYPEKKFKFVEVDCYQGAGSSLALSILQAKNEITGPFIFHACDTLVVEKIPEVNKNWLGGAKTSNSSSYVSYTVNQGLVTSLKDKGALNYDYSYIGIAGIFDYKEFFCNLEIAYANFPADSSLNDVSAISKMLNSGFTHVDFNKWLDIGNSDGLRYARQEIIDKFEILDKDNESIFLFDKFVIKFFYDTDVCINRVMRTSHLGDLIPKLLDYTANFYKYEYAQGEVLAHVATPEIVQNLLIEMKDKLWKRKTDVPTENFKKRCKDFYLNKTLNRIDKFTKETGIEDSDCIINGIRIPPIKSMLTESNFFVSNLFNGGVESGFHGDFILDNILYADEKFTLIDWRQDFGGELETGDMYYDLAKLNHNFVFNHDLINRGLFKIDISDSITVDIYQSRTLLQCQEVFNVWAKDHALNIKKINILTALIWINMAPLHHYPLNNFLFYFGKHNLYKALNGS